MMDILHLIEVKFGREKSEPEPIDLNMLKLNVVQGNEYEINKTKDELKKLKSDLESFPKLYCKKIGIVILFLVIVELGKLVGILLPEMKSFIGSHINVQFVEINITVNMHVDFQE